MPCEATCSKFPHLSYSLCSSLLSYFHSHGRISSSNARSFPVTGMQVEAVSIVDRDINAHNVILHAVANTFLIAQKAFLFSCKINFITFVWCHLTIDFEWIPGCSWINAEFTIHLWVLVLSYVFAWSTLGPVCLIFFTLKDWFWD